MSETTQTPLPSCPMKKVCEGMIDKPPSGLGLLLPGIFFVALGVIIVIEPRVLVWVMAIGFVFLGIMMLMMASFIRKVGQSIRESA